MTRPGVKIFAALFPAVFMLAVIFAGGGCSAKKTGAPPPWLDQDAPVRDQDYFYGRGCAQHQITNRFFKKDTARERARVDLAENMYDYLIVELDGDTTSVRAVIESVLPAHEIFDSRMDAEGNLCVPARLPNAMVSEAIMRRRAGN